MATCHAACGILVPWPEIEPVAPPLEGWSSNHWNAREVPIFNFLRSLHIIFHSGCIDFPPTVHKGSLFSTSLQTLVISYLVDNSHSNTCEAITQCAFGLHFPDDYWYWASSHVPAGHLYVFGKMSIQILCPFLNGIIWKIFFFLIRHECYILPNAGTLL